MSWIYLLLAFFLVLPILFLGRRNNTLGLDSKAELRPKRSKILLTIFRVLYYFLILALIAMISLEIARLVDADLGIGLLPFLYPAYLLAAGVRGMVDFRWVATGKKERLIVKGVNTLLWLMLITLFSIKVGAYSLEGLHSRDDRSPVDRYKVVDEVTDVAVMVGVAVVLAVMEVFW